MTKVADAGYDEFLGRWLNQHTSIGKNDSKMKGVTSAAGTSEGDLTHSTV